MIETLDLILAILGRILLIVACVAIAGAITTIVIVQTHRFVHEKDNK